MNDIVEIITNPRAHITIPQEHAEALRYLGCVALDKEFAASLIVNLYNPNIVGANLYKLVVYMRGESTDLLRRGTLLLMQYCFHCESHEIFGDEYVRNLIKRWGFGVK